MKKITFNSEQEFILWLMNNPGKVLTDDYKREWKYENYTFSFKDIGQSDYLNLVIACIHLYKTNLYILN